MVLYDYDSNAVLAEPVPNCTKKSLLAAFTTLHAQLCDAGLCPQYQRLDNECSDIMKDFMKEQNIKYQLVPPGVHCRNAAERAIRTLKNHLIAGFCSLDENFPLSLWDKLLPHALMSLNMLRGSRINPKLSAYAQLHGAFDFNATPLAPPGIRVLIHEKPHQRKTWWTDGTLVPPWNRTAATAFGAGPPKPSAFATHSAGSQPKCKFQQPHRPTPSKPVSNKLLNA
jgi:hypothetical protein